MSAENIAAYLEALADHNDCRQALYAVASQLTDVAGALRSDPYTVIFSNSGMGLPGPVALARDTKSFNANEWPTPQKIMTALANVHNSRDKLRNAWLSIEERLRSGLQRPPSDVLGR